MRWLLFVMAFAVGGFVTVQTGSNTRLKETLGEPFVALILSSSIGVAGLTAALVTGQLVCSVVLDHFSWVGFEAHTASPLRLVGCALMVVGFVLIARF